jgi:NAD(P)H-flavin reductase
MQTKKQEDDKISPFHKLVADSTAFFVKKAIYYKENGFLEHVQNLLSQYGFSNDIILECGPHVMAGQITEFAQRSLRDERFEVMKEEGIPITAENYKNRFLPWFDEDDE